MSEEHVGEGGSGGGNGDGGKRQPATVVPSSGGGDGVMAFDRRKQHAEAVRGSGPRGNRVERGVERLHAAFFLLSVAIADNCTFWRGLAVTVQQAGGRAFQHVHVDLSCVPQLDHRRQVCVVTSKRARALVLANWSIGTPDAFLSRTGMIRAPPSCKVASGGFKRWELDRTRLRRVGKMRRPRRLEGLRHPFRI